MSESKPTSAGPIPDLGPQNPKDSPFTARMRFHQSWYRAAVLNLPPGSPRPGSKAALGSMLRQPDGNRGKNFLSGHIFNVVNRRLALHKGVLDVYHLHCDLLSPLALAFNLFAQPADLREVMPELVRSLFPGEVKYLNRLMFAYTPEPTRDYLNDRGSFDLLIDYTRSSGEQAFIAVLALPVPPAADKVFVNPAYITLTAGPASPWREEVIESLAQPSLFQLWRSHLLVEAVRRKPGSRFDHGRLLLLHHEDDGETRQAAEQYAALLKPGQDSFHTLTLNEVVRRWSEIIDRPGLREWLDAFRLRYLDLDRSQEAYEAWPHRRPG